MMTYQVEVFGKCILAGEHSVLRGVPALVVPVRSRVFRLSYDSSFNGFEIDVQNSTAQETRLVIWSVIEKAISQVGKKISDLKGKITIENSIPLGAGLGASAALCVAVGRLFVHLQLISQSESYEFCRRLENLFHGESSGVDIAVAEQGCALKFVRNSGFEKFEVNYKPSLYLSYCGHRGVTSECVQKVKTLWQKDYELGVKLDEQMLQAVKLVSRALNGGVEASTSQSTLERQALLIDGFRIAKQCFEKWGLTKGDLDEHMTTLLGAGALAVKPTGSGGGGHALSLWSTDQVPKDLGLFPIF